MTTQFAKLLKMLLVVTRWLYYTTGTCGQVPCGVMYWFCVRPIVSVCHSQSDRRCFTNDVPAFYEDWKRLYWSFSAVVASVLQKMLELAESGLAETVRQTWIESFNLLFYLNSSFFNLLLFFARLYGIQGRSGWPADSRRILDLWAPTESLPSLGF